MRTPSIRVFLLCAAIYSGLLVYTQIGHRTDKSHEWNATRSAIQRNPSRSTTRMLPASYGHQRTDLPGDLLLSDSYANDPELLADAGPDQLVFVGEDCRAEASLDATASSDPDGGELTYAWVGLFGTLNIPKPTVKLPVGTHVIRLYVRNKKGQMSSDTVTVAVESPTPSLCSPPHYETVELSTTTVNSYPPVMNDRGDLAWAAHDGNDFEILLFERASGKIRQLTDNEYDDVDPYINCHGDVVWNAHSASGSIIYLYRKNSKDILQLSNDGQNSSHPRIACSGDVIWTVASTKPESMVCLFRGETGETTQISRVGWISEIQISPSGDFAWFETPFEGDKSLPEVFLYDHVSQTIRQITDSDYPKLHLQINCKGDLVWVEIEQHMSQILVYKKADNAVARITDNYQGNTRPQINCDGDIVWAGKLESGEDGPIFFYDAKAETTSQLSFNGSAPKINCRGDVVWAGSRNHGEAAFLYEKKSGATIQITNEASDYTPLITCMGELVWQKYNGDAQTLTLGMPET